MPLEPDQTRAEVRPEHERLGTWNNGPEDSSSQVSRQWSERPEPRVAGNAALALARTLIFCVVFLALFLLLNLPQLIAISQLGAVVWYPASGLAVAVMATFSPWYGVLCVLAATMSGALIYHQPWVCWSGTLGAAAFGIFYGTAAHVSLR